MLNRIATYLPLLALVSAACTAEMTDSTDSIDPPMVEADAIAKQQSNDVDHVTALDSNSDSYCPFGTTTECEDYPLLCNQGRVYNSANAFCKVMCTGSHAIGTAYCQVTGWFGFQYCWMDATCGY